MKKFFPFVVVLFFHCGCVSNHSEIDDTATVFKCDIENTKRIEHLSDICDSVSIIKIETVDSTLMSNVDKILFSDSLFYIQSAQKIFVVDFRGKVQRIINRIGHAGTEYISIGDFSLSRESVVLFDHGKVISISKGSEKSSTSYLDFSPERIICLSDTLFLFSSRDREASMLALYDSKNQKTISEWFDYETRFSIPLLSHFSSSDNEVLHWQSCSNDVFAIDSTLVLRKKYSFDFGEFNFKEGNIGKVDFFGMMVPYDIKGSARIENVIETDKYLSVEFDCQQYSEEGWYIALYPKNGEKPMIIDSENYLDDILFTTYRVVPDFSTTISNDYAGIIYPAYWKECVENADYEGERFQWVKEYTSKLDDSMNPIIVVYHMK